MTQEQYRKRERIVNILSIGTLVVLIFFLAFCAWKKIADTPVFPVGIGLLLVIHWFFSDIFGIKYLNMFHEKTDDQKRSYCVYAAMELVGFGGLTFFLVDMNSTTGAIVYVACMFLKKRFIDEFRGIKPEETIDDQEEEAEEEETEEFREELPQIELEIPEVRATEEDLIAQTQVQKND